MATALFVCRQNAGRSQMSAALFEHAAAGRHRALSVGRPLGEVRATRDDIARRVAALLADLDGADDR